MICDGSALYLYGRGGHKNIIVGEGDVGVGRWAEASLVKLSLAQYIAAVQFELKTDLIFSPGQQCFLPLVEIYSLKTLGHSSEKTKG